MPHLIRILLPFGTGALVQTPDDITSQVSTYPCSYLWFLKSGCVTCFLEGTYPRTKPAIPKKRSTVPGAGPLGEPVFTPPEEREGPRHDLDPWTGLGPFNMRSMVSI